MSTQLRPRWGLDCTTSACFRSAGLLLCSAHGWPYLYVALWRLRLVVGWCRW